MILKFFSIIPLRDVKSPAFTRYEAFCKSSTVTRWLYFHVDLIFSINKKRLYFKNSLYFIPALSSNFSLISCPVEMVLLKTGVKCSWTGCFICRKEVLLLIWPKYSWTKRFVSQSHLLPYFTWEGGPIMALLSTLKPHSSKRKVWFGPIFIWIWSHGYQLQCAAFTLGH